jgi:hypothetical protein
MGGCALLPLMFGAVALSVSRTKSATMDDPLHASLRVNFDDPEWARYKTPLVTLAIFAAAAAAAQGSRAVDLPVRLPAAVTRETCQ